jgi:aldehyde:ferredoxin oxidoreductase
MAAATVLKLQTVVSRNIAATDSAVVTVGTVHVGTKENIISDRAELTLSVRTFEPAVREKVLAAISRIAHGEAHSCGAPQPPDITTLYSFPAVTNDPDATKTVGAAFVEHFGADPVFVDDIGMENKGMEYSLYMTKESLAQQGGYGMTNKGAQHDEAWLIFMDMVNNQIPTFEEKAEALHYFPMWRTWFGLNGLCKLPWNDIEPADNALTDEPAKIPEHVANYVALFSGITGVEVTKEDLIFMSERVYNFQRVFNLRMGRGTREHDAIPYRSAGPVTVEEYESRVERYDKQLREKAGMDPTGMSTPAKVAAMREYREAQYQSLIDAVYARRGWTLNGVPTLETLKKLEIDFPEVVAVVKGKL